MNRLALAISCLVIAGPVVVGADRRQSGDEATFRKLAAGFKSDATAQFEFKASMRVFGHLSRPWETRGRTVTGAFTVEPRRLVIEADVRRDGSDTTEKELTSYSSSTLFRSKDGRVEGTTKSEHAAFLRRSCRYSPAMLIRYAIQHATSLRFEVNDGLLDVRGASGADDYRIRFSTKNAEVESVTWYLHHEMFGDQEVHTAYSNWKTADGIHYPEQIVEKTFGIEMFRCTLLTARKAAAHRFLVPDSHKLKADEEPEERIEVDRFNDRITFLHLTHTESRTTVVEFRDYLFVIDAPVSPRNGRLILEKVTELNPNKPVKLFAFGHHHPHYLAGVRSFIANGTTVLTAKKVVPYLHQLAEQRHTRNPDALQKRPRNLKLREFADRTTITDGEYSVKVFDIGMRSKHTSDYLFFYFPAEKLMLQGDGIWLKEGEPVGARTRATYEAVLELGLDVDLCVQGWPTTGYDVPTKIPFKTLQAAVNAGKANTSEADHFTALHKLVGKWKNTKKKEFIEYRLISRDSVLVERWTWPDREVEGMTVYHMDGKRLMATHYCPAANQPRLLFDQKTSDERYVFEFDSVTNLPDRSKSHCVQFWLKPDGIDRLKRSETYRDDSGDDESVSEYVRIK